MAKRAPSAWGSFIHYDGDRKPRENSPQGIRDAVTTGKKRIDLDSQMTLAVAATRGANSIKIRSFANTHWANLAIDEFVYTAASVRVAEKLGIKGVVLGKVCRKNVHNLPWSFVSTLKTLHGGYPICSMAAQIALAAKWGVDIEHETKDIPTVAEFRRIFLAAEKAYGPDWRKHYLVKRLWSQPGAGKCLANARAADARVNTLAIDVRPDQIAHLPAYVSHYRARK